MPVKSDIPSISLATMAKLFDRDISWLAFNGRVLQEAADATVPLFERVKFLAIFSNNLDEFYRVRVAALSSIKKLGTELRKEAGQPKKILSRIRQIVHEQQEMFGALYKNEILPGLRSAGVEIVQSHAYGEADMAVLENIWHEKLKSIVIPKPLQSPQEKVFLENRKLYFIIDTHGGDAYLVPIPVQDTGRFVILNESTDMIRVTFIDDVIRHFLPTLLPDYAGCYSIKLSRDGDLQIDDEYEGVLLEKIREGLKNRDLGEPVRMLYDTSISAALLEKVKTILQLKNSNLFPGGRYHNFSDFFGFPFPKNKPGHFYPPQVPVRHPDGDRLLETIQQKDVLLQFPYQTFDHISELLKACIDTGELEFISMNIYRTSDRSSMLTQLIEAAQKGIRVTVFIEAKARFDEANNLSWGQRMEATGVHVIYSFPGIKVHSKLLQLGFPKTGSLKTITMVSTGNFHEGTAKIYTDWAILTADPMVAHDAAMLFDLFQRKILVPKPDILLVSPYTLRAEMEKQIDREIEKARSGKDGIIFMKLNNLQDTRLIRHLYEASQAGVRIRILVRGICRLIPGVEGLSENIEARSVVGRYLEHSRAYVFGNEQKMFVGSADWMTRNMDHRIETLLPVRSADIREAILQSMEWLWNDRAKARQIEAGLSNSYVFAGKGATRMHKQCCMIILPLKRSTPDDLTGKTYLKTAN